MRLVKANTPDEETLTFQIAHGYDSCLQFRYGLKPDSNSVVGQSKIVSGIDVSRPLSFNLNPTMINTPIKNSYIISVFRLPHMYTQLINNLPPTTVIKVFSIRDPPEIWYLVGIRKNFESLKTRQLKFVVTSEGKYEKELYTISGNLPRDFIGALRVNQVKNVNFLHGLSITLPRVLVNNGPVRIE
ncbi:hypothetical protein [Mocis latipes granulovirus]|uniref:Uncharacterized protein n=1 Tax=Mocis latipes granulovirus TaxID=2072024 RepID=A0A161C6Z9_9BBAC|nr:hypothetical protein [Mocis latipes granulovirus]AKR17402.1 hypothetical protein [Mocis latipes granulovirus]